MSRFSAWVWKEWRERRIVLFALLGAVALITALPFVIDHWSVGRPLADLLCAFSVLLAMPVLGLNLFASETRHGSHALLLRTPGALRTAFAAKWAFLLGGTLLAFLVSHATRAVASAITGAPHAFVPYLDPDGTVHLRPGRLEPEHWFGVPGQVFLPLLAAGLGAWHVVGSVWARRGGAASLAGVLTLLVLATPMIVLASLHWWWLAMPPAMAVAALLAGGAAAVAVAAWSWGSGRRYLHPPRAAWTRGLAATAGLALVVTGGSAWSIDRWEAADEHAPEFRIGRGVLGAGGRYLYLDTWRGRPADGNYPDAVYATYRSTPRRGWRVDLRPSGSAQDAVAAKWSTYGPATPDGIPLALPVGPVPWLRRADSRQQAWAEARFPWVDAATGEESPSAPRDAPLTQDGLDRCRALARAMTPYRDAKGRRVWWLFGQVERDGEAPRVTLPATRGWSGSAFSMWDGWRVRQPRKVDGIVTWIPGYVDAETGTFLALPDAAFPLPARARFWRGYQTVLVDENLAIAQGSYDADEKTVEWGPFLVDSRGGAPRPIPGVTDMDGLAGLSRGTLLRLAPGPAADPSPRLVLWRPAKDEVVPLKALDPTLARPSRFHLVGRVPGGRWLFEVWSSPLRVGRDGRVVSGPPGPLVNRSAVVQLDERTATLESLTPWVDEGVTDCIGLDDDGSFVGVEGMRRVVRWTDGGARRTVLFPRGE